MKPRDTKDGRIRAGGRCRTGEWVGTTTSSTSRMTHAFKLHLLQVMYIHTGNRPIRQNSCSRTQCRSPHLFSSTFLGVRSPCARLRLCRYAMPCATSNAQRNTMAVRRLPEPVTTDGRDAGSLLPPTAETSPIAWRPAAASAAAADVPKTPHVASCMCPSAKTSPADNNVPPLGGCNCICCGVCNCCCCGER